MCAEVITIKGLKDVDLFFLIINNIVYTRDTIQLNDTNKGLIKLRRKKKKGFIKGYVIYYVRFIFLLIEICNESKLISN